jgi:hypothetical protein
MSATVNDNERKKYIQKIHAELESILTNKNDEEKKQHIKDNKNKFNEMYNKLSKLYPEYSKKPTTNISPSVSQVKTSTQKLLSPPPLTQRPSSQLLSPPQLTQKPLLQLQKPLSSQSSKGVTVNNVKKETTKEGLKETTKEGVKDTAMGVLGGILLLAVTLGATGLTAIYVAATGKSAKVPISSTTITKI